jgi:hypothetical protein
LGASLAWWAGALAERRQNVSTVVPTTAKRINRCSLDGVISRSGRLDHRAGQLCVAGHSVASLADLACGNAGRLASIGGYLVWGCPLGAGFTAECGDGGCNRREEVMPVDRAGEPVAFDLAPYWVLEFGENQADVLGVQRLDPG